MRRNGSWIVWETIVPLHSRLDEVDTSSPVFEIQFDIQFNARSIMPAGIVTSVVLVLLLENVQAPPSGKTSRPKRQDVDRP